MTPSKDKTAYHLITLVLFFGTIAFGFTQMRGCYEAHVQLETKKLDCSEKKR